MGKGPQPRLARGLDLMRSHRMQAVRSKAVLADDHRLQLTVPEEMRVSPVEVIVLSNLGATDRAAPNLGALLDDIDQMPTKPLTKEEVDRAIANWRWCNFRDRQRATTEQLGRRLKWHVT